MNEELAHRFEHHPPATEERALEHTLVRAEVGRLADWIDGVLPASRERALALTKLEEVMFWANAAVARQ